MLELDDLSALLDSSAAAFKWAPCSYTIVSEAGQPWPAVQKALPISLQVRMTKEPTRAGESFRWHKNCVLPRIHVAVEGAMKPPENAAVLLSAVSVDVLTHTAQSVGLDGECLRPLVNGACSFSSLAFKTTSYNLPGRPSLHLMATLLVRQSAEADGPLTSAVITTDGSSSSIVVGGLNGGSALPIPLQMVQFTAPPPGGNLAGGLRVAASAISPAMTVDARKRQPKPGAAPMPSAAPAATPDGSGAPPTETAAAAAPLLPFAPDLLERKLEKVDKEASRLAIDNSMDGLRAYLSALNIRNKCKHPLFLVLRFDTCMGLLYDASSVRSPDDDDEAFFGMMACLGQLGQRTPPAMPTGTAGGGFSPYVVAVKSDHPETHACDRSDCPVRLSAALSLPHSASLPASYKLLGNLQIGALRRTYCRLYCKHASRGLSTAIAAVEKPQLCATCIVPPKPLAGLPGLGAPQLLPPPTPEQAPPHSEPPRRHAMAVLDSVRQMAQASAKPQPAGPHACGVDGCDSHECPEQEWEEGLRILAEALSLHCRTRSAAEITGFMQDASASAAKRPMGSRSQTPALIAGAAVGEPPDLFFEHSHDMMSDTCNDPSWALHEQDAQQDADRLPVFSFHSHSHNHTAFTLPMDDVGSGW